MTPPHLGRLERVDLRAAWTSESGDLTPWLAREDNLALLGEALEMGLELEAQEQNVGPFRADIVARDTATRQLVLIENQLERTDHSHLGQLLTYAAGLHAVTIVWLAPRFTDEHRAALDWLNEVTREGINFFALEIELWRIGDSPPAPKFNVVSQPNEWAKRVAPGGGGLTATQQLQLDYWSGLREMMIERGGRVRPVKPHAQNWLWFALGRSGYGLAAVMNRRERWVMAQVVLDGPHAQRRFLALKAGAAEIERELGEPLIWDNKPARRQQVVSLFLNDVDPTAQEDWPRQHEWLYKKLETLHRVFAPLAKADSVREMSGQELRSQTTVEP